MNSVGRRAWLAAAVALCLLLGLSLGGCATLPRDSDESLERVRAEHVLRAGASPSRGLVAIEGPSVSGPEADLVASFAAAQGAQVQWRPGGEEELMVALEAGELDVVVGGLSEESPWTDRVALTRPYAESRRGDAPFRHVLAVRRGENALLTALETHLDGQAR